MNHNPFLLFLRKVTIALIELLRNVSLFTNLTDDQLTLLSQYCSRASIRAGTILFNEKEFGTEFFIIVSGSVKIFTKGANSEEKILSVIGTGDSFGELALIDGKPRSASASTLVDCVMLVFSKQNFFGVLASNFDITLSVMQVLCQRLRDTNQHVHDLTFLDSRTRVLKQLIQMANKHGTRAGTTITLRNALNFDELSLMAGVQKEVLMQVLRELEQRTILHVTPDAFTIDLSKLRT